jgi:hypothetical protein
MYAKLLNARTVGGRAMKHLKITCDGCDRIEEVVLPLGQETNFTVSGWVAHHAVLDENGSLIFENWGDLCPVCAEKMRHAINPSNWPRMDPVVRQFAKKTAS